ncbi:MAG: hypothetical protein R3320_14575, partial [Nitriliruptorales bacterium]|nr:hypothetical protein [Nitriliruptorales bacterium]
MSEAFDDQQIPKVLRQLTDDQKAELLELVTKKAWIRASRVAELTGPEKAAVAKVRKKGKERKARNLRDRLYRRHHWDSLRWFLFGGWVDLPLTRDPRKAWDPETNPYVKIHVPGFAFTRDEH